MHGCGRVGDVFSQRLGLPFPKFGFAEKGTLIFNLR
jgi:hypothetical protein